MSGSPLMAMPGTVEMRRDDTKTAARAAPSSTVVVTMPSFQNADRAALAVVGPGGPSEGRFDMVMGDIPWVPPNIVSPSGATAAASAASEALTAEHETEMAQLSRTAEQAASGWDAWLCAALCCLSGVGCPYVCCKLKLIEQGRIGFGMDSGRPTVMRPGWHMLASPLHSFVGDFPLSHSPIKVGPVTIVRVPKGQIGFASMNGVPEVLLPGTHARNSGVWQFHRLASLSDPLVEFGPIKFVTVPTGHAQLTFHDGAVDVLQAGRYAVNSATFKVGQTVYMQEQVLNIEGHVVMLDGGVNMKVDALLRYQIRDLAMLQRNIGVDNLANAVRTVVTTQLSKLFAPIHLESISSIRYNDAVPTASSTTFTASSTTLTQPIPAAADVPSSAADVKGATDRGMASSASTTTTIGGVLSPDGDARQRDADVAETRAKICAQVTAYLNSNERNAPFRQWGIEAREFQIKTIRLADEKDQDDYENATLKIALKKAELKSNAAENRVTIQHAEAKAQAQIIAAGGRKQAAIVDAQARAEAMRIEADGRARAMDLDSTARQRAAEMLKNPFGQQLALTEQRVQMAGHLKANTLVLSDNAASRLLPVIPLAENGAAAHH